MARQRGFTLLELLLVLGISAVIIIQQMEDKVRDAEQMRAKQLGVEIYQYNNAVRGWLSEQPAAWVGNVTVSDLRSAATCGAGNTGVKDFLPCTFPAQTTLGQMPFNTVVTLAGTTHTATTTFIPLQVRGGIRPDLSGLAVLTASGGSLMNITPAFAATDGRFASDPSTAIITMTAGNNPTADAWLRTDGSNQMQNNITFNPVTPWTQRQIFNVDTIANLAGQPLRLSNDTIVNGYVAGTMFVDSNNTNFYLDPNQMSVLNQITTNILYDAADTGYFVKPAGTSRFHVVLADTFADVNNPAFRLRLSSGNYSDNFINVLSAQDIVIRNRNGNVPISAMMPKFVHMSTFVSPTAGQQVAKPACAAGGVPKILVIPYMMDFFTMPNAPYSATNNPQAVTFTNAQGVIEPYATDVGANWRVYMGTTLPDGRVVDPLPDRQTGSKYNYRRVLVNTYCYYA